MSTIAAILAFSIALTPAKVEQFDPQWASIHTFIQEHSSNPNLGVEAALHDEASSGTKTWSCFSLAGGGERINGMGVGWPSASLLFPDASKALVLEFMIDQFAEDNSGSLRWRLGTLFDEKALGFPG